MPSRSFFILSVLTAAAPHAAGDELLYRYEGDVLPYDKSAGWVIADPCDGVCSESLEDGHFVLRWDPYGNFVNYHLWIARPEDPPPPESLWVEWRFRSSNPIPPTSHICDAKFTIHLHDVYELIRIFGDAAVSNSGDDYIGGLDIKRFHTYRFESPDGRHYWFSVDGLVFTGGIDIEGNDYHYLQFGGGGLCNLDQAPGINEWDFIHFGTMSYGEQIIASDPPGGFLNARQHAGLDRFTITFDEPNYVYLDEITVEVTGGVTPEVIQTRRRENDEPDTVEIVLDRPIAFGESVRFTFDDGAAVNVVEYTFALGDTDGDGDTDLQDFALFQTCFRQPCATGPCTALDLDANGRIGLLDYALFHDLLATQ